MSDQRTYLSGFGNTFVSEALAGAVPERQNSPQRPAHGLYAEQLSGSAFTMPRHGNLRTWLYRGRPSVVQGRYTLVEPPKGARLLTAPLEDAPPPDPNQQRWDPLPYPEGEVDFVDALTTYAVAGSGASHSGCGVHLFAATASMDARRRAFYSADGELLIVAQEGRLAIRTELGVLDVKPGEIALIPRGMKLAVSLPDDRARGYVCENYGAPFVLPDRGPIGGNSLASARHFLAPVADYELLDEPHELVAKFQGRLWRADLSHSPFDVAGWHGNYVPFKYDLANFQTIGTVDFDHPDPSIFTVLTSPTPTVGLANVDFVIFPPRWMVGEHTFRPPYYHRNIMSEFMGLIMGAYDAKEKGFVPGGASLHNQMLPHGPDAFGYEKAVTAELKPVKLENTLAFMFETRYPQIVSAYASELDGLQDDYIDCWQDLQRNFPKQETNT